MKWIAGFVGGAVVGALVAHLRERGMYDPESQQYRAMAVWQP